MALAVVTSGFMVIHTSLRKDLSQLTHTLQNALTYRVITINELIDRTISGDELTRFLSEGRYHSASQFLENNLAPIQGRILSQKCRMLVETKRDIKNETLCRTLQSKPDRLRIIDMQITRQIPVQAGDRIYYLQIRDKSANLWLDQIPNSQLPRSLKWEIVQNSSENTSIPLLKLGEAWEVHLQRSFAGLWLQLFADTPNWFFAFIGSGLILLGLMAGHRKLKQARQQLDAIQSQILEVLDNCFERGRGDDLPPTLDTINQRIIGFQLESALLKRKLEQQVTAQKEELTYLRSRLQELELFGKAHSQLNQQLSQLCDDLNLSRSQTEDLSDMLRMSTLSPLENLKQIFQSWWRERQTVTDRKFIRNLSERKHKNGESQLSLDLDRIEELLKQAQNGGLNSAVACQNLRKTQNRIQELTEYWASYFSGIRQSEMELSTLVGTISGDLASEITSFDIQFQKTEDQETTKTIPLSWKIPLKQIIHGLICLSRSRQILIRYSLKDDFHFLVCNAGEQTMEKNSILKGKNIINQGISQFGALDVKIFMLDHDESNTSLAVSWKVDQPDTKSEILDIVEDRVEI